MAAAAVASREAATVASRGAAARTLGALALANARYWPTVAPRVRSQLGRWSERARAIEEPELRALALAKLRLEGLNAQAAAIAATLAPRPHRAPATRAIVALELLYDYLDGVTERRLADPLGDGARLYGAFVGAFDERAPLPASAGGEDAYARALAQTVRDGLAQLPARAAVAETAQLCAQRAAQAQVRMHAVAALGHEPLAQWAREQARAGSLGWREQARAGSLGWDARARESRLGWREQLAGAAASVLTLHALIAAAADPATTSSDAQRIDEAYVAICALATLLDGIVDREADIASGRRSYASLYDEEPLLANALAGLVREGAAACARLRNGAHHLMTLAAVVAFWSTAPGARRALASPAYAALRIELGSLVFGPAVVMRAWRAGRRIG